MNTGDSVPIKDAEPASALVTVIEIVDDERIKFKRLELRSETGYWMTRFAVNIFDSSSLYATVAVGDKLRVKYVGCSQSFKYAKKIEKVKFHECRKCHQNHEQNIDLHTCPSPEEQLSRRINGLKI